MVLTVNGKAKLVIEDACAYQAMLDELERFRFMEAVKQGLADADAGHAIPAKEAFRQIGAKLGL